MNKNLSEERLVEMYIYKALTEDDQNLGFSKFLDTGIFEGKESARFRGSLIALFGEPLYKSDNAEGAYHYVIEVSRDASKWYFAVYQGPSGPAIGYSKEHSADAKEAAEALLNSIRETAPADFHEVIYYEDFGSTITYGCTDGECFYKEENEETP